MRARFLLPVLTTVALLFSIVPSRAQQAAALGEPTSAKSAAFRASGATHDGANGPEVVAQAIYVKLKKGMVEGTPAGTAARLAARVGLSVAEATPRAFSELPVDKETSSRLAALPAAKRARVAAAQEELSRIVEVHFLDNISPREAARRMARAPGVEYAEPIPIPFVLAPAVTPNDSLIAQQTHLGLIKAFDAWSVWSGDTSMVIGIVDGGVDMFHEDLAPNIQENRGEVGTDSHGNPKQSNGIDDDNDGVIDDWRGANLTAKDDGSPNGDTRGINHGTVVSGLAAAATNNGIGIAGTGYHCRFFPVKTALKQGGNLIYAYDGIEYCARRGMKVINCSFGSPEGSQALEDILTNLVEVYDVAIVAASGNDPQYESFYPAAYKHVFGVGAINDLNTFGTTWGEQVDVTAPSDLSTNDNNSYTQAGVATSFATPVVSGVVALVRSKFPNLSADQTAAHVRLTADNIDIANVGKEKMIGYGRVNALRAVSTDPFSHPAIMVDSIWLTDMNDQPREIFGVGDQGKLHIRLTNLLGNATNVGISAAVYGLDTAVLSIEPTVISLASLASEASAIPTDGIPFRVKGSASDQIKLRFSFTANGGYTDYQYQKKLIYRPFATSATSLITLSLTSLGHLGYEDYPSDLVGDGFTFDGVPLLYEGGFIFSSDHDHVVSNVRDANPEVQQPDFVTMEPASAANDSTVVISDINAAADRRIGLEVRIRPYIKRGNDNAIGLLVRTKNVSGATIDSLRIGMFNDWDIDSTPYGQRVEYVSSPGTSVPFYGRVTIAGDLTVTSGVAFPAPHQIFYAIQNDRAPVDIFNGFTLDKKWITLSNGVGSTTAGSLDPEDSLDFSLVTGKCAVKLAPNAEDTTLFVFGFGYTPSDALNWMRDLAPTPSAAVQQGVDASYSGSALGRAQPNPFTGKTTFTVRGGLHGASLRIFDAFGREIADLTSRIPAEPRQAVVAFDASALPSGTYYIRLSSAELTESQPLLLTK